MKVITMFAALMFLIIFAGTAQADCIYNGRAYPTGTNIGGVVCQPNGTWR
jgi:hypothetical protein